MSDYEIHDNIKKTVIVDIAGTGDYTSIDTAYKYVGPLSSFDNQYLIKVLPGTYHPINATPPAYSHTLAIGPLGSVLWSDTTGSVRMVDQQYPSKLEGIVFDMKNSVSYILHIDVPTLYKTVCVNTNCKFIHRGGGTGNV